MALSQRKNQQQQRSQQNQLGHHNKNNRTKGPAPQAYVFHDISNYDDNETDQYCQNDQYNNPNTNNQNNTNNNYADDTDFNSSCCDYQSDVFKEQPSQYLEDSNSKYQMIGNDQIMKDSALQGMLSMHECRSESDFKENLQGSAFQGGYSSALSPRNNNNQYNSQLSSGIQQKKNESQQSLRLNHVNSALESQKKESRTQDKEGRYLQIYNSNQNNNGVNSGVSQSLKNSCDHSIISPNYRSQNNGTSTTNKNNKQPLYSMVPGTINKNLNKGIQQEEKQQAKPVVYQYETNKVLKTVPMNNHDDSTDYILSGQNRIQNNNNQLSNTDSYQNLTPQKNQPQPMSPSLKPIQTNNGGIATMVNNSFQPAPYQQQVQQFDSRNFNNQMPSSIRTQNSGQKATVVYNEFKYYTSSADLNNTQNPSKYINIASSHNNNNNNGVNAQRKSDISASHISGQPTLQYELSPGNVQNMFDVSSPKQSVSNGQASFNGINNGASIRANSIRKQIVFNTDRNHHTTTTSQQNIILPSQAQNYQLQLKQETPITQPPQSQDNLQQQDAQLKIQELKNYIQQLEFDLKESQDKNQDLKKRFKEKSFIQSFDNKNHKKHISDTEDSLILSEKKGRKNSIQTSQSNQRNSLTKQNLQYQPGNNSLIVNQNQCNSNLLTVQNTNSNTADAPQRSSSIVDVKIRPIVNLKNYQQINNNSNNGQRISPEQQQQMRYSGSFAINNNNPHIQQQQQRRNIDQESDNQLEYQVQDFNDYSVSQMNQSNDNQQDVNQQEEQDSQMMGNNHQHMSEDECEGCERLKQLVFQAKEAIDDLKLEIEEWRDICSDRETELRQLHHRIYNDIMGVDKKIEFNEEVQTKEFDPAGPVTTADQRKIRNYIQHNKKRIRSRSKTTKNLIDNNGNTSKSQYNSKRYGGVNVVQCIKKKSALKGVKDLASEEFEFFEAEDIGLQTSFECIDKNYQQVQDVVNSEQLQTNVSIDSTSLNKKQQSTTHGMLSQYTSNRKTSSPDNKQQQQIYEALKTTQADEGNSQQYLEELCTLRTKNQIQEQEICKMRSQMSLMTGQIEKFVGLMQKAKKKNNKKNNLIVDIEDIKQNHELISNIESYSILEKINEWKREEGLIDQNSVQDQDPLPSQIPRPLKLIQDIDLSEIELFENNNPLKITKLNDISSHQTQQQQYQINSHLNNNSILQQSSIITNGAALNSKHNNNHHNNIHSQQYQSQMNNAQEFLQMIKIEQENIKRQTDQKYKELQKQQQEYLNVLKGV